MVGTTSGPARRAAPADFVEAVQRYKNDDLLQLYRCGSETLRRWRQESGLSGFRVDRLNPTRRPAPADFAERAPAMTATQLRSHYDAGTEVVRRWCTELRVYPAQATPRKMVYRSNAAPMPLRDESQAGRAADHLRRTFTPVCKLRTIKPDADKDLWIVGRLTLTTEELIAKAEGKGWNPRAWAMAA